MRKVAKVALFIGAAALGAGLVLALADESERNVVSPPSTWKGSQGIKQPTGFEVPGCPWYKLNQGRVQVVCGANPELSKPANQTNAQSGSTP